MNKQYIEMNVYFVSVPTLIYLFTSVEYAQLLYFERSRRPEDDLIIPEVKIN